MNDSRRKKQEIDTSEDSYQDLKRSLKRRKGFGLFFVQCSPAQGKEVIEQVKQDFPQKKVEVLSLESEIKNLYDLIEEKQQEHPIDILFIVGIEKSLIADTVADEDFQPTLTGDKTYYGGQGTYYRLNDVPPILAHLNLQRERFRDNFNFSLVFILPKFALKYFIRRAPDFFDWRSGIFEFVKDKDTIELESERAISSESYKDYLNFTPAQRQAKIHQLEDLIEERLQTDEGKADLWYQIGLVYYAGQDYTKSIFSFDQALKIKPDYQDAWNNRGNALGNLGRLEEAVASYDQALKINPDYHLAWNNRGIALKNLGRLEEAVASYDQALKFKPDKDEAWNNRGIALKNLGRLEEAVASFDQALKIKPDYHKAWNNRGIALKNLGRLEEAVASYDQALKINPDYHKAWNNRGVALDDLGRLEEAVASYDQALKINPDDDDAWNNRGVALENLRRLEEAVASYDQALKINPDYHLSYYNKALSYALQGNIELSLQNLQQALNLDEKYREMAKTETYFDKIRGDERFQKLVTSSK